jgi:Domain of unknown function (DUF4112)
MMVVRDCDKVEGGLPNSLRSRMLLNVVLDFFIGLVPFIGDIADAIYKCNTRNAVLLERHLRKKANTVNKARTQQGHVTRDDHHVDLSLPEEFDRYEEGTLPDPPGYIENSASGPVPSRNDVELRAPAKPQSSHRPQSSRHDHDNGRDNGRKQKPRDLESGLGPDH